MPRVVRPVRGERASSRRRLAPPPMALGISLTAVECVCRTDSVDSQPCHIRGVTACGPLLPLERTCVFLCDIFLGQVTVNGPPPVEERMHVLLGFYAQQLALLWGQVTLSASGLGPKAFVVG